MDELKGEAPNLDIRTLEDTHRLKVTEYPTGHVEATLYFKRAHTPQSDERDLRRGESSEPSSKLTPDELLAKESSNKDRSLRRSRSTFKRHCLNLQVDRMITLTTRANITDRAEFHQLIKKWLRRTRAHLPDLAGVAVFETQKRGAWHLHMAVRGHYDVRILRHTWQSVCDSGSVNIRRQPGKVAKLIGYLCKYMTKAMSETSAHAHRFLRTGRIPASAVSVVAGTHAELFQIFLDAYGSPVFIHSEGDWSWLWQDPA